MTGLLHLGNNYALTVHFMAVFLGGGMLAKHRETLTTGASAWPSAAKYGAALLVVLCYNTSGFWLNADVRIKGLGLLADRLTTACASFFIVGALSSQRASHLLTVQPLLLIGIALFSLRS